MSELATSLLFGNVDEEGQLEQEEWSQELRKADFSFLARVANPAEILASDKVEGGSLPAKTEHAPDAQDFADIDETVEDESSAGQTLPAAPLRPLNLRKSMDRKSSEESLEVEDDRTDELPIEQLFPGFSRDKILKFSKLFVPAARKTRAVALPASVRSAKKMRIEALGKLLAQVTVSEYDEKALFESDVVLRKAEGEEDLFKVIKTMEISSDIVPTLATAETTAANGVDTKEASDIPIDASLHPVNTIQWENLISWGEDSETISISSLNSPTSPMVQSPRPPTAIHRPDLRVLKKRGPYYIPNYDLECGDWTDQIIWDDEDESKLKAKGVTINLNDPYIFVELSADARNAYHQRLLAQKRKKALAAGRKVEAMSLNNQQIQQQQPVVFTGFMSKWPSEKFNLSNDLYYEFYRRSGRVRQMFGRSHIQHAMPALRLQLPFFKRFMSKSELRSFHRPFIRFSPNTSIHFTKVKNIKKKKVKGKDVSELLASPKDITLRDNSHYLLFEYSEEYPPLLSNGAMGSIISNFYRKRDERDPFVPRLPDGIPTILEQVDASPFFGFGDVFPGQTMQALKNNLFIAPIFKHEAKSNQFLFIRCSIKGQTKYYIRELPRLYCVGQTFPTIEVHQPQSRKVKFYIRDRLKFASLRFFRKKGRNLKYRVNKIINSYHQYHEQSLRKHLRDFGEIQKSSTSTQMYLKLRDGQQIPGERELFKLVSPEMVCAYESMRVGQQRLADAGFGTGVAGSDDDDDEVDVDDEILLAPWNITKNFLLATQGKGMCKLYGPGDPTGRGEGFSFFRFSMKKMFIRSGASLEEIEAAKNMRTKTGHKFSIVDQQKVYRDEILRIWFAQLQNLSNPEIPNIDEEDQTMEEPEEEEKDVVDSADEDGAFTKLNIFEHGRLQTDPSSELASNDASRSASPFVFNSLLRGKLEGEDSMTLDTHSVSSSRYAGKAKSLLIRRKVKTEDGEEEWEEEVLSDQRVINAYLKKKRLMEILKFNPEDDEETQKRKLMEESRRLKRLVGSVKKSSGAQNPTTRKCRACGQVGHIQSNRVCPLFAQRYPDRVKKQKSPPPQQTPVVKAVDGKLTISASMLAKMDEKKEPKLKLKLSSFSSQPPPHP